MLKVAKLFGQLSHGELSNLSLAGEGDGTISIPAQPKVILAANDGLLDLFGRFTLKESNVLITLLEDITHYHLIPRFAENYTPIDDEDDEPIRYIMDSPGERFEGDILRINKVFNSDGVRLPLNDTEALFSLFTPEYNILQVVQPVTDMVLDIQYQARHAFLTGDLEQPIYIPEILEPVLRQYIAYKVFGDMNSQDSFKKAQQHLANYQIACQNTRDADLVNSSTSTSNTKFEKRGWV